MSQKGFSLIELMVTLAVLAVVLGLAAPSFSSMLQDNRALSVGSELHGALQFARSEAVKRHVNVVICRRNAAGSACDNGADWSAGWLVRQAGGDVLKVWDRAEGLVIAGPNAGLTFRGNGMASAAVFSVKPTACTDRQRREISVLATGSSSVSKEACQ